MSDYWVCSECGEKVMPGEGHGHYGKGRSSFFVGWTCSRCGQVYGDKELHYCPPKDEPALRPEDNAGSSWPVPVCIGWECPCCHRCYNPVVPQCRHCPEKGGTDE